MKKQKITAVVEMSGGCINRILVNREDVELRVIFTETEADNNDEVFVEGGDLDGELIYSTCGSEVCSKETLDAVVAAGEKYNEA